MNFESRRTYSIVVESYDDKTRSFIITRSFNISVTDRNDPPFNMRLSWNVVKENAPIGTVIGQLTAEDEDENPKQTLFFTLTDDSSGRFAVSSDGTLTKKNGTDYETAKQHTIQVKVTDNGSPPLSVCTRLLTLKGTCNGKTSFGNPVKVCVRVLKINLKFYFANAFSC